MLSLNLIVMHLWIVLRETHCLFKLTVAVVLRSTGVLCYWQQWASLSPECSGDVTCYDGARVGGPGAQHSQAWANTGHTHGVDTVANIKTAVMKSDQVNHLWEPVWCHDMGPITCCQWVEVRVHSGHNTSNNTGWHQRGAVAVASHKREADPGTPCSEEWPVTCYWGQIENRSKRWDVMLLEGGGFCLLS